MVLEPEEPCHQGGTRVAAKLQCQAGKMLWQVPAVAAAVLGTS